ncbi:MAG: PVC-type heme-binding CxxCH protein [Planctomycetota bacterium]
MKLFFLLITFLAYMPDLSAQEHGPSVQRATESLKVLDGFRFQLVASEPLINDPVSARLDARGRLWVVEMPDYPTGPRDGQAPSGKIKILEDRNADGVFDHATLFADGLLFATGLQPYRDGAIVTLAGQIVFMRDVDDDGISDQSTVWFKGFAEQNQQLRANHPILGPDGLVYVANGLRGGKVEAVDPRYEQYPKPLDLRDRDFCFDPDGGWWGAVSGKSQFGLTIDDYGRRVGCSNRNPAMTPPIPLDAIDRDPLLAARDAIHDVALAAEQSRVVARADAWTTSNLHGGQFSAACGVLAAGMEDASGEWIIACEPTAYLVQKQRMTRQGSTWMSRREELPNEFLSSSDTWFRPVDLTLGPQQSVYVVDMARAVIEHPDFMPTELKTRPDQWHGQQLGRIWQVMPLDMNTSMQRMRGIDAAYDWLESDSPWQRQVASQRLLESAEVDEERLHSIVDSNQSPQSRARAARVLQRHKLLRASDTKVLATANNPRLRALAIELASGSEYGLELAIELASDPDPLVLRTVAISLVNGEDQTNLRISGMVKIASTTNDAWILRILGSSHEALLPSFAEQIIASTPESAEPLLSHLITRIAISDSLFVAEMLADNQKTIDATVTTDHWIDWLEAWVIGTKRARVSPSSVLQRMETTKQERMLTMLETVGESIRDDSVPAVARARALEIANRTGRLPSDVRDLIADDSPPELRIAALPILLTKEPEWTRDYLSDRLVGQSVTFRSALVRACSRSSSDTKWLLSLIENNNVPKSIIDPATAKRFRQHSDPELRQLAGRLLKSDPNRAKVLQEYARSAQKLGDAKIGRQLFVEHCSACHRIDEQGTNVGPDISDTRIKTAEALLTSILDPNAAIDASYVQYSILTLDGQILDGLLIDENSAAVTLQRKGGKRVTVAREDIDVIQAPGVSLMPEGFETSMDVTAMSHLLAYLKNWRYLKTTIPGTLPAQ